VGSLCSELRGRGPATRRYGVALPALTRTGRGAYQGGRGARQTAVEGRPRPPGRAGTGPSGAAALSARGLIATHSVARNCPGTYRQFAASGPGVAG